MRSPHRRRFLQLVGAATIGSIAGCSNTGTTTSRPTETPIETPTTTASPTRTDTPTKTASSPPEPAAVEAWTVDRLSGQVDTVLLPDATPTDGPTGPLIAATEVGEIARIDAVNGRHQWTRTVRGAEEGSPAVAVMGDTIYAVSETFTDDRLANHVEALNPETGDVRWTFEDRSFLRVRGVTEELVVVAGEYIETHPEEIGPMESPRGDGRIYGLDRTTGEKRWAVDIPELRGASVASHGIYALERKDFSQHEYPERLLLSLIAINHDGTERWRVETGTVTPLTPLAADGLLIAGAGTSDNVKQGGVGRYDPADGSLLWTAGDWAQGPENLAFVDDTIHAGGRWFLALDRDGTERYRVSGFQVPEVPATPKTLYNSGGSHVTAVNRAAGEIRWRYRPIDYKYTHIRAVLADYVAVDRGIGNDREVVLISEDDGEVAGAFETPGYYFGMVGTGRRLFAGVEKGIVAYDIETDR